MAPPSDAIISKRITVTLDSYRKIVAMVDKPREPTRAMRDLMTGKPIKGSPW